jgi:hypothetical protein
MQRPDRRASLERVELAMQVIGDDGDVRPRVEQLLGVTVDHLARVTQAAAGGRNSATSLHPSSTAGSNMYYEGTAALRRELLPDSAWDHDEANQQPRTFNNDRRIAVIVQSGDEMTGIDGDRAPRSKHGKGRATRQKVVDNRQGYLFDLTRSDESADEQGDEQGDEQALDTWVLLLAEVEGELRAELSRPHAMDDAGRVSAWTERILLPATPLGGDFDLDLDRGDDGNQGDAFDVSWQS